MLTLSAGGARGTLVLGALDALLREYTFDEYRGTSIGAVIAAGLAIGRTPRRMLRAAQKHGRIVPDIRPGHYGVDSGKGLRRWIARVLGVKRDTRLGDVPGLTVCVYNATTRRAEYWTAETHPDVSLVVALGVSCGVPLVFAAHTYRGNVFVDGAVADPVPIGNSPERTLAVVFEAPPPDAVEGGSSMEGFLEAVRNPVRPVRAKYVVRIDPKGVEAVDFSETGPDELLARFKEGRRQASLWLKKNV